MTILKDQMYRHYKGGLYRILAVGLHTDYHEEKTVIYQNIDADVTYTDVDNPEKIWVRAMAVFESTVDVDGKAVKRFELVS